MKRFDLTTLAFVSVGLLIPLVFCQTDNPIPVQGSGHHATIDGHRVDIVESPCGHLTLLVDDGIVLEGAGQQGDFGAVTGSMDQPDELRAEWMSDGIKIIVVVYHRYRETDDAQEERFAGKVQRMKRLFQPDR